VSDAVAEAVSAGHEVVAAAPRFRGRPAQATQTQVGGGFPGLRGREVDLPGYCGPLELLLKLIRKNEVDIYDIPIATITEQYLQEIDAMEQQDLLIAGDFLLMAATLLEIKSAMMLPRPPMLDAENDTCDPRATLVERLLEYQAFRAAADEIARLEGERRLVFARPFQPSCLAEYGPFYPPVSNLTLDVLMRSLGALLRRLEAEGEPVTSIPRQAISLRLRALEILANLTLAAAAGLSLEALVQPCRGRLHVIVGFLAILELLKSGRIQVRDQPDGGQPWFWSTTASAAA
jgi:segregation and condensation protein A